MSDKTPFIKTFNGVEAPAGFHYMPSGKLMSDAHHIARYGYIDVSINSFNIDTKDINYSGERRSFTIVGSKEAYFSLEVHDNATVPNYYNFYTDTWSTQKTGLYSIKLNGNYNGSIKFLENTTALKNYTILLTAETVGNLKTSHTKYVEFRNLDNSININKSRGSNSNILKKVLYQDVAKKLYLSCIAPSLYSSINANVDGATSSVTKAVLHNDYFKKKLRVGDLITASDLAISVWNRVSKLDPDGDNTKEIELEAAASFADDQEITLTPEFNGTTPHDSDSTTGRAEIEISTGGSLKAKFEITITAPSGRLFFITKIPNTNDLCTYKNVTFGSSYLVIDNEDITGNVYHRWPINNIAGLKEGMVLDPSRAQANTTTPAYIKSYITTENANVLKNIDGKDVIVTSKKIKQSVPGVDAYGNDITAVNRNGVPTAQAGNITFNVQQHEDLSSDANVRIFGYGPGQISSLTDGMSVRLSDVELTPAQLTVVTSGSTSESATVPIAATDGGVSKIVAGATISGANISPLAENPTVVSKAAQTGAANITLNVNQTLEAGQTLNVDGVTNSMVLSGTIDITNFPLSDTTLYFDLERFLKSI